MTPCNSRALARHEAWDAGSTVSGHAARMSQGRKSLPLMLGCSREPGEVRRGTETSQFADHLARSHLLRLFADGRPPFLVPDALVKNLPN